MRRSANLTRRVVRGLGIVAVLVSLTAGAVSAASTPVVHLTLKGSVKGMSLNGPVQIFSAMCVPLSGRGLEITWAGMVGTGGSSKQVSGDMSFQRTGKSTFGPKGTAIASLVVNNDYSGRLGSGLAGGSGAATVSADRKSGTIKVHLVDGSAKVEEQGTWVCR
jgi:hypothetical protein